MSSRSLDSPSTSAEALSDAHHMASNLTALQDDSDVEVEPELPPLEASIPKETLKKLRKSEKKRQDVINGMSYEPSQPERERERERDSVLCGSTVTPPGITRSSVVALPYLNPHTVEVTNEMPLRESGVN